MTNTDFRIDWHDHFAVMTLTRPEKLNAITGSVLQGLEDCLDEIEARQFRGLVVTGDGDAFSAGTDLEESSALTMEQGLAKCDRARQLFMRLHRSPITSVAAINGLAFGGGLELAMACTLRVASESVLLGLPEVKLGVLPAYGGTQLLPALIGKARAAELMLTGRSLGADEALQVGLVSKVVAEPAVVLDEAIKLLGKVTRHSQFAIERIRRCLDAAGSEVSDAGLEVEAQAMREATQSEDAGEGLAAFLEKRRPNFKHC